MDRLYDHRGLPPGPVEAREAYRELDLPSDAGDRPYTLLNMVTTLDGKAVVGPAGSTWELGGPADHTLFRALHAHADAVVLGAGTVRADAPTFRAKDPASREARGRRAQPLVVVVSGRASLDPQASVLEGERGDRWVAVGPDAPANRRGALSARAHVIELGPAGLTGLWQSLRREGVRRLYLLGGPMLNGEAFRLGLVDECYTTLTPRIQGGSHQPSMIEGPGFAWPELPRMQLLSVLREGGTLFLRHRVLR